MPPLPLPALSVAVGSDRIGSLNRSSRRSQAAAIVSTGVRRGAGDPSLLGFGPIGCDWIRSDPIRPRDRHTRSSLLRSAVYAPSTRTCLSAYTADTSAIDQRSERNRLSS